MGAVIILIRDGNLPGERASGASERAGRASERACVRARGERPLCQD